MWNRRVGAMVGVVAIAAMVLWAREAVRLKPPSLPPAPTAIAAATAAPLPTARPPTAMSPLPAMPQYKAVPSSAGTLPVTMRVPKMGIRAPVVTLGLNPDGSMASPDGPDPVAWYNFSGLIGTPGNAVFAGHVDWHTGVTGVFWLLRDLQAGDPIYIVGQDGAEYGYAVTRSTLYSDEDAPINDIIGPRPGETITLITCEGVFNAATHNYDQRRVVIAERESGSSPD